MRLQVLALAAGLVLTGPVIPAMAQTPQTPPPPSSGTQAQPPLPRFHEIVGRMSAEGQAIMAEAVGQSSREQRKLDALKETRVQILTLIAAPQLDAEALGAAFERERVLSQKVQARRQAALLKAATLLSAEDRKLFAEGLRSTRLHIPGETVRQIQKRSAESRKTCPHAEEEAAPKAAR